MQWLRAALEQAGAALLPARCALCGLPAQAGLICAGCHADLPWNQPACPCCAAPQRHAQPCTQCRERPPPFDDAWAAFRYDGAVREAVLALKYHAGFMQARWLGEAMAVALSASATAPPAELPSPVLIPVPLHAARLRRRGYNQALELARVMARRLRLRCEPRLAQRRRATADQIGQSAAARRRNLRGAFSVSPAVRGRRVVLVDDVMTTGSTLAELARACRRQGAATVSVWVAARTPH